MFRRFGSEVTIIESASQLANREDRDIADCIQQILEGEGIRILTNFKANRVEKTASGGVRVTVKNNESDETQTIEGTHLLVSTGRRPNTDKLNLESVGLKTDDKGFIPVNGKMETDVPGIWALGDINKYGMFTHTAVQDYEIVIANHEGGNRSADDRIMTWAIFVDPPYGRVGMNEQEARESGKNVLMVNYDMADVSRARLGSETRGMMKILVDADTEKILGAGILGLHGDELVQVVSYFMHTGASYKVMRDALPIHPTMAEYFPTVLQQLKPLSEA
jgi:pyruvate/2-oxoglutarate dehydrogenase complex dihydrolipoamide dehydrogenase (E3) component